MGFIDIIVDWEDGNFLTLVRPLPVRKNLLWKIQEANKSKFHKLTSISNTLLDQDSNSYPITHTSIYESELLSIGEYIAGHVKNLLKIEIRENSQHQSQGNTVMLGTFPVLH